MAAPAIGQINNIQIIFRVKPNLLTGVYRELGESVDSGIDINSGEDEDTGSGEAMAEEYILSFCENL